MWTGWRNVLQRWKANHDANLERLEKRRALGWATYHHRSNLERLGKRRALGWATYHHRSNLERLGKRCALGWATYHHRSNLERLEKRRALAWAAYHIVQTLKGWGSVTRWRGQPKGEDTQWFSFPLRNPPAFLSIAALIFHQSADWFVFVRGGFFMRTTRAGRGQSRKDWQRRRISEPSWTMRAMEQPVNRRGG